MPTKPLHMTGSTQLPPKQKTRQSNMELLRILSMFMVLMVHADGASLGLPSPEGDFSSFGPRSAWQLAVESVAIVGVNCFTLISGYFGIRLTVKGISGFLFQCLFYAVGISSAVMLAAPQSMSWDAWLDSWLILSNTDLWYVPAYFGLMVLAPVLNKGADSLSRREFSLCLGLFVAFNLWCGWWFGGKFNPTGYTLVQLIMVYLTGRYIRFYIPADFPPRHRALTGTIYLVSTVAIYVMSLWMVPLKAFAYNSPAVLCASVSLLMFMLGFSFKSKTVNYIAKSAFAAYLLHKTPVVWGGVMKPTVVALWRANGLWPFTGKVVVLCAAIYAVAMAADAVRRWIWSRLALGFRL